MVMNEIGLYPNHSHVKYTFKNSAFQGFAAHIHDEHVLALSNMTHVAHVEEAVKVTSRQDGPAAQSAPRLLNAQTRASSTWGLQRISSQSSVQGNPESLDFTYAYESSNLGQGVDIYVVDTGVYTDNLAFGGRARMGFSFESDTTDGDGHGTHVSGTAAGSAFGVASNANIIGVKVLGSDGSGSSSDTVAGIDYVVQQHDARQGQGDFVGSIMSMSWGLGSPSQSINDAILAAVQQGIHTTVAAGNAGSDACASSPSQLGGDKSSIISVGSVGEGNAISSFSNTGKCVDIFAPGENIVSAWKDYPNEVNTLDGTSMATPHVTGVMAYLMASDHSMSQNPQALKSKILGMALQNVVKGTSNGGTKLLLSNGVTDPTGTEGILSS